MPDPSLPPYRISIDGIPPAHLRVQSFTGKETISEAWSFDVVVTCDMASDGIERTALGKRAVLVFNTGERLRAFYGIVAAIRLAGVHRDNHTVKYEVRVVPRLWLLKRKKRTRIFQNLRVPDIVSAVLAEAGIAARFQLTRAYPMREYCTQYEETDYRFIQRILAEAAIYFYFPEGPPVDDAALAADAAIGAAAAAGETVLDAMGASAVGSLVGEVASIAETLIPGDTVICADDAACYPPVNGDDGAALAASTAAALAPAVGDLLGAGDGLAGAAIGAASAVAGTVIAEATEGGREAPVLHFLENEELRVSTDDKVTRFSLRNTVRSSAAAFRDYDPDKPMVRLHSAAVSTAPFPPSPFEEAAAAIAAAENAASVVQGVAPLPAAVSGAIATVESVVDTADAAVNAAAGALGQKVPFEVYDHHSPFLFPKWAFGSEEAPRIMRQKRRRASIARGEGGCSDLAPGHRFTLREHPAPQLDGDYVVTFVEHRGETHPHGEGLWRVYWNRFECAPAEMTYPPPRPKRKSVQVSLTATVTGPPREEIWVDEKGQIKVQFHWDREGKYDDKSSCWIRVMQPWAGAAWGHQFIPRVGMEVVVIFEGGDPDKPMVLGSLYNGTHPTTFKLPRDRTRSGIRTHSTPGGHGFNELSFDDAKGREQVFVHAERDFNEVVEHNHGTVVRNNRHDQVLKDHGEDIGGTQTLHVHGDRRVDVKGDQGTTVQGTRSATVRGDDRREVAGNDRLTVLTAQAIEVRGSRSVTVGEPSSPRQCDQYVYGSASLGATERLFLRAEKGIVLECGGSRIELTPEGVKIEGSKVDMEAEKGLSASSKDGPSLSLDQAAELVSKEIRLLAKKGSLELDDNATVRGQKIRFGPDDRKAALADENGPKETASFSCQLSDYNLKPYANKTYHLYVQGLKFEGTTDGDGAVNEKLPKDARQVVIKLWIDDYPTGRQRIYALSDEDVPGADTPKGAMARLRHLGYLGGPPSDEIDDAARRAISLFQRDHKDTHDLDPTGELDGPTAGALADVYGS